MKRIAPAVLLLAAACAQGTIEVEPITPPSVPQRSGALVEGTALDAAQATMSEAPLALGVARGGLWVAVSGGAVARSGDAFTAVPVGAPGEAMATGAVTTLARRGEGLLLWAAEGLFHDADGRLLRSPLSDSLAGEQIRALDSHGSGANEEIWLVNATGLLVARQGSLLSLDVRFKDAPVRFVAVAGVGQGRAVAFAENEAFEVDAAASTVTWAATGLGQVREATRSDDGTVFVATEKGLWRRDGMGAWAQLTLTADGQAPAAVSAVASGLGQLLVASQGKIAKRVGEGFTTFGALNAKAHGLALDAQGATWVSDGTTLTSLSSAAPAVSFETQVKPFFQAHCMSCHATQIPVIALTDYATASAMADLVSKRLRADGTRPMPPPETEVLTSDQYAVVLQWIAQGKAP